jgi:gliding motility-associated-like protein
MNRFCLFLVFCLASLSSAFGQINCRNTCLKTCQDCEGKKEGLETVCDVEGIYPTGTVFEWDMGDGAKYSTPTAVHTFAQTKMYTVGVTIRPTVGSPISLTKQVYITQMPRTFLGNDSCKDTLELCSGTTVIDAFKNLPQSKYPNPSNLSVTWFPNGETTNQLTVDKEGCYSVKIKDNISGCYSEARLRVMYCQENNCGNPESDIDFWMMGNGTKVYFQNGRPVAKPDPGFNSPAGSSRFGFSPIQGAKNKKDGIYTNGDVVKTYVDSTSNFISNLGGDINLSQATAILPKKSCSGCNSEFYIFGMKQVSGKNQLFYSVFDISGNGGSGAMVIPFSSASLATPISSFATTDKLLITKAEENEYWINAFEEGTNRIYRYKLDSLGLSKPTRVTFNGIVNFSSNSNFSFSPKNDTIAIANVNSTTNEILLLSQNISTGELNSNILSKINLGPLVPSVYSVAFSPNGKVLYVTTRGNGTTIKSQILQFDLTAANIASTKIVVYDSMELFGSVQLDPNNKARLYIAIENTKKLAFIPLPNNLFTGMAVPGSTSNFGIDTLNISGTLGKGFTSVSPPIKSDGPTCSKITQECKGITFKYKLPEPPKCKDPDKEVIGANWEIYEGSVASLNLIVDPVTGIKPQVPALIPEASFKNLKSINYSYPNKSPNPKIYVIVVQVFTKCGGFYFLAPQEFEIRNLKPFLLRNKVDKLYISTRSTPSCISKNITLPDPVLDKVPALTGLDYNWNSGAKTPTITVDKAGKYSLKIEDPITKCSVQGDIDLSYYTEKDFIPKIDTSICMDNPSRLLELKPIANPASLEFLWSERGFPLGTNPSLNVTFAARYDLRVRDEYGCLWNRPYTILDKCLPVVLAPNIFTPNGDKVNDRFVPQPLNAARTEIKGVKIFNRWGELLFEVNNNNPDEQWDGTYKGKRVPQDTYVYVIEYISTPTNFPEIGTQTLKGGVLVAY